MREIPSLTGLRFLAAFAVFAYHGLPMLSEHGWFRTLPMIGMTTFFCLSGFVLTITYSERLNPGRYALARFARIYPLFFFLLVVMAIVTPPASAGDFISHALLVQVYAADHGSAFFGVTWSLCVELVLYVTFPFVLAGLKRVGNLRQVAFLAIAFPFVLALIAWKAGAWPDAYRSGDVAQSGARWLYIFPLSRMGDFVAGCALGLMYVRGQRTRISAAWVLSTLALVAYFSHGHEKLAHWDALWLPFVALLIYSLATDERQIAARAIASLRQLGRESYAFYLVQAFTLGWLVTDRTLTGAAVALVLNLVLARLLHRHIEEPARRWLLSRQARERVATATA